MTYTCAWCGDTSNEVLEVINGQNTCDLCEDLAKEGESKCVCTDEPPYQECFDHSGY